MIHPLRHLGDQLHHNRIVHRTHRVIADLQQKFDTDDEPVKRAVTACQIEGALHTQADHLAASWLARLTTMLPRPAVIREEARNWHDCADALFAEAAQR